ncbi:substrate-binding domain-containing protein [Metabacillus idriensis]
MASAVSSGIADVGVGIEKAAKTGGIDFVPLMTEQYDLLFNGITDISILS